MDWFPIGPAFVLNPHNPNYKRISSRNSSGQQCMVQTIVIAPSDPNTYFIYAVSRPWTVGASIHCSIDGGLSWRSICDTLQRADPSVDPSAVAVHPRDARYVVMGTYSDKGVYVSTDGGDNWGPKMTLPEKVLSLVIDGRPALTRDAVIYAGTEAGLFRSVGGTAFDPTPLVSGPIWDLAAVIPDTGMAQFYACVWGQGLLHANDPSTVSGWALLSDGAHELPSATTTPPAGDSTFLDAMQVAICPNQPTRAYAWIFGPSPTREETERHKSRGLWTTDDPRGRWTRVPTVGLPDPGQRLYCCRLAIASNSPGDGDVAAGIPSTDILLFCSNQFSRSTDGGRNWATKGLMHDDYHAIAFYPLAAPPSSKPVVFFGCDGGIGRSSALADPDPAFDFSNTPTYWNEGSELTAGNEPAVSNRWFRALAMTNFATAAGAPTLAYSSSADTGVAAYNGNQTWRYAGGEDGATIAAIAGRNGLIVFYGNSAMTDGVWPAWGRLLVHADSGAFGGGRNPVLLAPSNTFLLVMSNLVTAHGRCYAGVRSRDSFQVEHNILVRIDEAGTATAIMADLHDNRRCVSWIAADPTSEDVLYAVYAVTLDGSDPQVLRNSHARIADGNTTWDVIAGGDAHPATRSTVTVGPSGRAFVLFSVSMTITRSITTITGATTFQSVDSPLYEVMTDGTWRQCECASLPSGDFSQIVADPVDASILYATVGARVYRLHEAGGVWTWTDLGAGLPGRVIAYLEAIDVGPAGRPHVVLRAGGSTTCIWERDAADIADTVPRLYMRGNVRDPGYLRPMPEGQPDPYRPVETVWHYQSPDIVLDALQTDEHDRWSRWHQIDPEYSSLPIDAVTFGQLLDNSHALPGLEPAMVHVQIHNRSSVVARNVRVWALAAPAAGGLPSLFRSDSAGNAFAFWNLFDATGAIASEDLPTDSPWRPVGVPLAIDRIEAGQPAVASWLWSVPLPPENRPLHYCIVVFVHSQLSPIGETTPSADEAAARNPQIAQKNLHIMPVLAG